MRDPFPYHPPAHIGEKYIRPLASALHLHTLPFHYHEIVFAFLLYHITNAYLSPWFSRTFFPRIYASFNARTKLNWDVHIVSFVQSTLINILALWVLWNDEERLGMNWRGKVWGYTGAAGLIQGFAAGYFVWDLMVTVRHLRVFGLGMLAHAVSALFVFSLGFRPFVNSYAPIFILYELSSPFLNIHWFCDKLNLTGSKIQLYNGILLLVTFFSARLVFGTYQSVRVFSDIYQALTQGRSSLSEDPAWHASISKDAHYQGVEMPTSEIMRHASPDEIPLWLAACYLASNLTLNGLNWYWFGKMIQTLRKRFDPPFGTRRAEKKVVEGEKEIQEKLKRGEEEEEDVYVEGTHIETPGAATPAEGPDYISRVKVETGGQGHSLRVQQAEIRNRAARRMG